MAKPVYADVEVTYNTTTRELKCDPEFVRLYFDDPTQPSRARWIFKSVPAGADLAIVEILPQRPAKYAPPPIELKPRGVSRGFGAGKQRQHSLLPVIVTGPNTAEQGVFYYVVRIVNDNGDELAVTDPGGTNDPRPPYTNYP